MCPGSHAGSHWWAVVGLVGLYQVLGPCIVHRWGLGWGVVVVCVVEGQLVAVVEGYVWV